MASDLVERLRATLPSVSTPMMQGDNLAITLCSHFDNPDQEADNEHGWTDDAIAGCDEVCAAIHVHYADTIASLRFQLAEQARMGSEREAGLRAALRAIVDADTRIGPRDVWWMGPCAEIAQAALASTPDAGGSGR